MVEVERSKYCSMMFGVKEYVSYSRKETVLGLCDRKRAENNEPTRGGDTWESGRAAEIWRWDKLVVAGTRLVRACPFGNATSQREPGKAGNMALQGPILRHPKLGVYQ